MQESRFKKRGESMAYNLRITKHAEELLDRLVYLLYRLKNEQRLPDTCWIVLMI